jgi:hypothetical protein
MSHEKKNKLLKAMQKEIKPSHENHAFELVKLRKSKRALNNKWVFRLKIEKKKLLSAKLQGNFNWKKGIDLKKNLFTYIQNIFNPNWLIIF